MEVLKDLFRLILFQLFINDLGTKSQSILTKSADRVKSGTAANSREFRISFRSNKMFLSSEGIEM